MSRIHVSHRFLVIFSLYRTVHIFPFQFRKRERYWQIVRRGTWYYSRGNMQKGYFARCIMEILEYSSPVKYLEKLTQRHQQSSVTSTNLLPLPRLLILLLLLLLLLLVVLPLVSPYPIAIVRYGDNASFHLLFVTVSR